MKKISVVVAVLVVFGGASYVYLRGISPQPPSDCSLRGQVVSCQPASSLSSSSRMPSSSLKSGYSSSSRQSEAIADVASIEHTDVQKAVVEKYAILFSLLQLSEQGQHKLHDLLLKREQILSSQFYDARSNDAEVAANLRKRDEDVAELDRNIEMLLSETDIQKYRLLKDSTYEQAQLNGFYELAGADTNLAAENKERLLLAKLEQKQSAARELDVALGNINNAASSTRPYLIEKVHQRLIEEKETYLNSAKALLTEDQFNLLREYEQQLFDERWRDIKAGFASE